jgi:hypothetical protein
VKTQTLGLLSAVGALAIASAASLISCSQPPIECTAAHGDFAVKYILVSGSDAACNTRPPDYVGFQTYNPTTNRDNCQPVGDDIVCEDTQADTSKVFIGLQNDEIGGLLQGANTPDGDATHKAYSFGAVTSNVPDGGFCSVPTLSAGQQDVGLLNDPDGEGGAAPGPDIQVSVTHTWSNLKLLVEASAPGTAFEADLAYSNNGCTAQFKAIGLYPPIDCGVYDDTGALTGTDPSLCNPKPDLSKGRAFGSGINPDFPTKCEETATYGIALCVLDTDSIATLKSGN